MEPTILGWSTFKRCEVRLGECYSIRNFGCPGRKRTLDGEHSMSTRNPVVFRVLAGLTAILAMFLLVSIVEAHAILKQSSPARNSTVAGPDVPITLQFNVRIDAVRSKLQLLNPDATTTDLVIDKQPSPDILVTKATGLKTGAYRIRWQVLAPDGHITRGEIPFTVTGS